jgi:Flp pilus assembly protein TadD/4-amino-4-deoxy-L-arabinose transferase-like glycosyltransferase
VWPLIIFSIALILRLIYFFQIKNTDPLFYYPILDSLYHHDWAASIIHGGWLGKDSFFRAPLYAYFLSFLYRIFGINLIVPRIVQSFIGAFSCVLTGQIGQKIFNKKVGNIAGIIAAFYPLFIYYDNEILIPSVLLFLVLLGFYFTLRQTFDTESKFGWFLTGLIWGLAAITRPNVILFIFVLPFWLAKKLKKTFKIALLYGVLGVLSVILPITVRNYIVSNEFVLISWQGGINFYIGNNPYSDGTPSVIPGTRKSIWGGFYDAKRIAEETTGRELKNSEIDRYWLNQGLEFIKKNPLKTISLFLRKTYLFFGGLEISNNRDIYFFTRQTYLKFLIFNIPFFQFPFGLLFPLFLVGCWYAYKKHKDISLVLVFVISYSFSFILFFVCARFRHIIIPFLIIVASFAIISVIDEVRKRKMKNFKMALVVFIVALVFFNANITGLKLTDYGLNYLTLADVEIKKGDYNKAIIYLREALNRKPDYAEALNRLGETYQKMGDSQKALFYFLETIKSDQTQPEAYCNIGNIYAMAGEYSKAKEFYLKSLEIDPFSSRAHNNLGNVYFSMGDFEKALECYQEASTLEPHYVSPLYHAGLIYRRLGNLAKAESLWKEVLRFDPGHRPAQRALEKLIDNKE